MRTLAAGATLKILVAAELLTGQGGQDRLAIDVAEGLATQGHAISLMYRRGGRLLERADSFTASTLRVGAYMIDPKHPASGGRAFIRAVRSGVRQRPDVVYMIQLKDSPFGVGVAVAARAVSVCHLQLPPPQRYGVQWTAALPAVSRFIAVSDFIRNEHVRSGLPAETIDVVRNGVDTTAFTPGTEADRSRARAELGLPAGAFVAAYVGRIDTGKGVEVLLDAWRSLETELGHDDRLVVCGSALFHPDGPAAARQYENSLRAMAAGSSSIVWLDDRADVIGVYRAADVVVVPSVWDEPAPLVALEAMACGRPIVGSAVGGIPEYLPALFPPVRRADVRELAFRLNELRGWREATPRLGAEGRAHVEGKFRIEGMVEGVQQVIRKARAEPTRYRPISGGRQLWRHGR